MHRRPPYGPVDDLFKVAYGNSTCFADDVLAGVAALAL